MAREAELGQILLLQQDAGFVVGLSSKQRLAHAKHSNSIGGCNMEHMATHKMSFPLEMLLRTYTS